MEFQYANDTFPERKEEKKEDNRARDIKTDASFDGEKYLYRTNDGKIWISYDGVNWEVQK